MTSSPEHKNAEGGVKVSAHADIARLNLRAILPVGWSEILRLSKDLSDEATMRRCTRKRRR